MKEYVAGFVAGFNEGFRDAFRLFWALIAAHVEVCKEFITSTGRFAPKQDDAHTK